MPNLNSNNLVNKIRLSRIAPFTGTIAFNDVEFGSVGMKCAYGSHLDKMHYEVHEITGIPKSQKPLFMHPFFSLLLM
jgi:hypothetical protein